VPLAAAGQSRLTPRHVQGPHPHALPLAAIPGVTVRTWHHLAVRWRDRAGTAERPARGGNGAGRGATGRERPYLAARVALAAAGAARAPVPDAAGRRPAPVAWRMHHMDGAAGMRGVRGPMPGMAAGLRQAPASPEPAGAVRRAPVRLEHVRLGPGRAGMAARGVPPSLSRHARPAGAAEPRAGRPASAAWSRPVRLLLPGRAAAEGTRAAALALRTDLVWRAGAHGAGQAARGGAPAPAAATHFAAGPAGASPAHAAPGAAAPAAQPGRAAAGAALDPAVAERLVQDVLRRAEQRQRIERERRGL
jgi:hypothetical protein